MPGGDGGPRPSPFPQPRPANTNPSPEIRKLLDAYHKDGFVVVPSVLSEQELKEIRSALAPYLSQLGGRNDFEGTKSERVYGLLEKNPKVFGKLIRYWYIISITEVN